MDFSNDSRYDSIFLDIIQNVEKLPNFLDVIFGFLRRRTDLYHILSSDQQNVGFIPGDAEKMIISSFRKHKAMFESQIPVVKKDNQKIPKVKTDEQRVLKPITKTDSQPQTASREAYVQDAESYNGATRDNYSWSQTINEIDIRVDIPRFVRSSKDVKVDVTQKHLLVSVKSVDTETFSPILDGDLAWEVRKHDIIWSFDPKESRLFLSLSKIQERWWDAFFQGEPLIDTRSIDCSRPMSDLDEEAQAKIQKLMYDQHQKQQGLPTSDEQKVNEVLRAAWDVEGSPFRGQAFDPTSIDIVGNSAPM